MTPCLVVRVAFLAAEAIVAHLNGRSRQHLADSEVDGVAAERDSREGGKDAGGPQQAAAPPIESATRCNCRCRTQPGHEVRVSTDAVDPLARVLIERAEFSIDWDAVRRTLVMPFQLVSGGTRFTLVAQAEAPHDPHNAARKTFATVGGVMQPRPAPRLQPKQAPP